jgi:hypothetical protein
MCWASVLLRKVLLKNIAAPGWGAAGGRVVDAVSARETNTAREVNTLVDQSATQ